MSSSALRGAVLVALAVLLGYLILRGAADYDFTPVTEQGTLLPTPTAVPSDTGAVALATPTPISTAGARPNSEVAVLVANGTEIRGQALRVTDRLRNQGFNTRPPENATEQPASVIYYRVGFAAEATVVREVLNVLTPIAPMPEPEPNIGEGIDLVPVDVLVLIGADDLSTG